MIEPPIACDALLLGLMQPERGLGPATMFGVAQIGIGIVAHTVSLTGLQKTSKPVVHLLGKGFQAGVFQQSQIVEYPPERQPVVVELQLADKALVDGDLQGLEVDGPAIVVFLQDGVFQRLPGVGRCGLAMRQSELQDHVIDLALQLGPAITGAVEPGLAVELLLGLVGAVMQQVILHRRQYHLPEGGCGQVGACICRSLGYHGIGV